MDVAGDGFIVRLEGVEQEAVRPGGACLTFEEADDVDRGVVPQFPLLTAVGRHYRSFPTNQQTHKIAPPLGAGTTGAVYYAGILASIQGKCCGRAEVIRDIGRRQTFRGIRQMAGQWTVAQWASMLTTQDNRGVRDR
jgi:hypothetical protein